MIEKCEIREIRFNHLDIEEYFQIENIKTIEIMPSYFSKEKKEWVIPVKIIKTEGE